MARETAASSARQHRQVHGRAGTRRYRTFSRRFAQRSQRSSSKSPIWHGHWSAHHRPVHGRAGTRRRIFQATRGGDTEIQILQATIHSLQQELATLRDLGVSPLRLQVAELPGRLATQIATDAQPDDEPGFTLQYQQSPAPSRPSDLYEPLPLQVPPAPASHLSPGVDTQRNCRLPARRSAYRHNVLDRGVTPQTDRIGCVLAWHLDGEETSDSSAINGVLTRVRGATSSISSQGRFLPTAFGTGGHYESCAS